MYFESENLLRERGYLQNLGAQDASPSDCHIASLYYDSPGHVEGYDYGIRPFSWATPDAGYSGNNLYAEQYLNELGNPSSVLGRQNDTVIAMLWAYGDYTILAVFLNDANNVWYANNTGIFNTAAWPDEEIIQSFVPPEN